jgi:hypothetical protein
MDTSPATGLLLDGALGAELADAKKRAVLCTPTDKNGEDPAAPARVDHLAGYRVAGKSGSKLLGLRVENQFGALLVDASKAGALLVPTAKSRTTPPAALPPSTPGDPHVDHFLCYKIKQSLGEPKFVPVPNVTLADQFGSLTVDVVKPLKLCVPVDKNSEDPTARQHQGHLLCYKVRPTKGFAKFAPAAGVFVNNQFGAETVDVLKPQELCVPSRTNPIVTTTITTTTSTTSTTIASPSSAFLDG